MALKWLNHGNRDLPDDKRFWTLAERSTQEWNDHYLELLKLLEDWKPVDSETLEDTYHMKAITYQALAELVPPGRARDNAIGNLLNFLDTSYPSVADRAEWFWHVHHALNRHDPEIQKAAAQSRNPVISLYATVQSLVQK